MRVIGAVFDLVRLGVMPVAPRIVNDFSYVTGIYHASQFAWQAQYFVMLEGGSCCCIAYDVSCVTPIIISCGALFGDVGG